MEPQPEWVGGHRNWLHPRSRLLTVTRKTPRSGRWPPLQPHVVLLCPLLPIPQPFCPLFCVLNTPTLRSQGLYAGSSLCPEHGSPPISAPASRPHRGLPGPSYCCWPPLVAPVTLPLSFLHSTSLFEIMSFPY